MQRPMLVGQAPGPNTDPDTPLHPTTATCAGGRLARFMGLSPEEYLTRFDRVNLINFFPGQTKRADKFPAYEAKIAAAALKPLLRGRTIILLGRPVALAWGAPISSLEFLSWVRVEKFDMQLACVPHPSGRNHWYNSQGNQDRALSFWQALLAGLTGTSEAVSTTEKAA